MKRFVGAAIVAAACTCAGVVAAHSPGDGDDFSSSSSSDDDSSGGGSDFGGGNDSSSSSPSSSDDWGSGGGGGGSSSSTNGKGVTLFFIVALALALLLVWHTQAKDKKAEWTTQVQRTPTKGRRALDPIRARDGEFSTVLFEDFVYGLYAEAQRARGARRLAHLSPFLDASARATLEAGTTDVREVDTVVIGAMQYRDVVERVQHDDVIIGFIANYTEVDAAGARSSYVVKEAWTFSRRRGTQSPAPSDVAARLQRCPCCGSPAERVEAGTCGHCGKVVDRGDFDWTVTFVEIEGKKPRTVQLSGDTKPRGQDRPSVLEWSAQSDLQKLSARDSTFTWERFGARVELVFGELQRGWSERDWERVRPYLSDALFAMWNQQMQVYRELRLINVLDGAHIERVQVAKVEMDRHYDAITLRIFVTGRDYRVREDTRAVVSGDPHRDAPYTEYWTLIRTTAGAAPASSGVTCPACGAPSKINMAGVCAHCDAKITGGRFDWVLSRIEQDSAYGG